MSIAVVVRSSIPVAVLLAGAFIWIMSHRSDIKGFAAMFMLLAMLAMLVIASIIILPLLAMPFTVEKKFILRVTVINIACAAIAYKFFAEKFGIGSNSEANKVGQLLILFSIINSLLSSIIKKYESADQMNRQSNKLSHGLARWQSIGCTLR